MDIGLSLRFVVSHGRKRSDKGRVYYFHFGLSDGTVTLYLYDADAQATLASRKVLPSARQGGRGLISIRRYR